MARGRKKNPFLTWISEYKGKGKYWTGLRWFGPILHGRIYEYRYWCELKLLKENGFVHPDDKEVKPYRILLSKEEIEELNKDEDVCWFYFGSEDDPKPVGFTEDEFKAFRRTKIIEHNINE